MKNEDHNTGERNIYPNDDRVDLVELYKLFKSQKYFIGKTIIIVLLIGIVYAFTTKNEYVSTCKLIPESGERDLSSLGGLSSLAGLAGINLNVNSVSSFSPLLYPEIVKSVPFQLKLLNTKIQFQEYDTTTTTLTFFSELFKPNALGLLTKYTIGLPGIIKSFSFGDLTIKDTSSSFLSLSKQEWDIYNMFLERQMVFLDEETGIIYISVKMPDRKAAAVLTQMIVDELSSDATRYKIEKVKSDLEFIEDRFNEVKKRYENCQMDMAIFTNMNRNSNGSLIQVEQERLQNELNLSFELYKGLASQLEQAKIKVKEVTPVFTIIEPAMVPAEKNGPKRLLILVMSLIVGLFMALGVIFAKYLLRMHSH